MKKMKKNTSPIITTVDVQNIQNKLKNFMAKTSNKTIIKVFFGSAARTNQQHPIK